MKKHTHRVAVAAAAALLFLSGAALAAGKIDYGMLFTGSHAPKGAAAKLKRAAQLAVKTPDCASVSGGFYVPPSSQMAGHKGQPYMITCDRAGGSGYNVYFSESDLGSGHAGGPPKPVARRRAVLICAKALRRKYQGIALHATQTAYDASRSSGNAAVRIGVTLPTAGGGHVHRVARCIVEPGGRLSRQDVGLVAQ
ncbi:MAG TPA: hypothetical protein VFA86_13850 [Gammaproteobacteria bacterium]|nr:hypothetical protein [Gammaproteobacteria bacterium]